MNTIVLMIMLLAWPNVPPSVPDRDYDLQVLGARAERVAADRIVLYHYVTKSRADYTAKMGRGSAMGNHKSIEFFDRIQERATANCSALLHLGR